MELTLIWGRINAMEMNVIQRTAPMATGKEKMPRWNGPRMNWSRYIKRRAIGIPGKKLVGTEVKDERKKTHRTICTTQ